MKFSHWLHALEAFWLGEPHLCPVCQQRSIVEGLPGCESCVAGIPLGWHAIADTPYPCFCLSPYSGRMKELIADIKYHGAVETAFFCGALLGIAAKQAPALVGTKALIPLPLHPERESARGFNQSRLLADGIHEWWRPAVWDVMVRLKKTESQSELSLRQRRSNVRGAFALRQGNVVRGRRIVLIDDILTTGATFAEAAGVIAAHGGYPQGLFLASGRVYR